MLDKFYIIIYTFLFMMITKEGSMIFENYLARLREAKFL